MKNIKEVLEKVYENKELRKTIVPLFIGNPGLGKTVLIEEFAKEKGVQLVELITSQMSPFEISGIAMPDKESKKMTYFNFDKLENLKDNDILFFDELLNGNPVVLNACLTILEQRRFISGKPLPDIMIVAAANPQGMAPLTPQIKERFVWYTTTFDKKMWIDYMKNKYFITESIGNKLSSLIINETFTSNNFCTPRSIDKAVNMLLHSVPTPYQSIVEHHLSEIITNELEQEITLSSERTLAPKEMISWMDLVRYKKGIKIDSIPIVETVPTIDRDDFVLPNKWAIKFEDESYWEDLAKFIPFSVEFKGNASNGSFYMYNNDINYAECDTQLNKGFTIISLKEFKKYVLKEKI